MKSELEQLRTRWRRWLGNKTRRDEPHWTTLLDSTWLGWVDRVFNDSGFEYHGITFRSQPEDVKAAFARAISNATIDHLRRLDGLYANEKVEKRR